jgi:hypothetical protein
VGGHLRRGARDTEPHVLALCSMGAAESRVQTAPDPTQPGPPHPLPRAPPPPTRPDPARHPARPGPARPAGGLVRVQAPPVLSSRDQERGVSRIARKHNHPAHTLQMKAHTHTHTHTLL